MSLTTVKEIEQAIGTLKPDERVELFDWLEAQENAFDAQVAADFAAGRLDTVIQQALAEDRDGLTRQL